MRAMGAWRKRERRLKSAVSPLIPSADDDELASVDEIEVYGRADENGFIYKGFIVTSGGVLKFGTGGAAGITKTEFKRILRRSELSKMSFEALIKSWHHHGLWEPRILEKRLVDAWLPRLTAEAIH